MHYNHFDQRLNDRKEELQTLYDSLYRFVPKADQHFSSLLHMMGEAHEQRPVWMQEEDENDKTWYLQNDLIGMMLYVDLFAGNLKGVVEKIPYLKELGITYVHFMPLLKAREGENDGGFAVADYREIDPRFGTMEEFRILVASLHQEGIRVCLDYVVNHTAKEHPWAKAALSGDKQHQDMYFMYDTDSTPKAFEKTVPEVFPKVSPGNFTYYEEMNKWVFTSFYEFQWDLDYHNPIVFHKMAEYLLFLANTGVKVIRLDAIPFMWKELGTNCRNLPQVHTLVRMFRIISEIVCPGVVLLGEAIVEPYQIVKYFGRDKEEECQILYNAAHMVNIWNSLATRDARLMTRSLKYGFPVPKTACWINYARCHDDIGWGLNEGILRDLGFDPAIHKQFLINFYHGDHPASFARGELYEFDPSIPDGRNSGSLASLAGLEEAVEKKDEYLRELARKRILLVHGQLLAESGIPLLYSGDEIATQNDYAYQNDSKKAHDSRWLHRPYMNWERAKNRKDGDSDEGYVFRRLAKLIAIRKANPLFRSDISAKMIEFYEPSIFGFAKYQDDQMLLFLGNYQEDRVFVNTEVLHHLGLFGEKVDLITGKVVDLNQDRFLLGPYEFLWLTGDAIGKTSVTQE